MCPLTYATSSGEAPAERFVSGVILAPCLWQGFPKQVNQIDELSSDLHFSRCPGHLPNISADDVHRLACDLINILICVIYT